MLARAMHEYTGGIVRLDSVEAGADNTSHCKRNNKYLLGYSILFSTNDASSILATLLLCLDFNLCCFGMIIMLFL